MRLARVLGAALAVLAVTVAGAVPAESASTTVTISVTVTGPSGALRSGCVKAVATGHSVQDCTATTTGTYVLAGLPRKSYEVTIYGFEGYQDVTLSISTYEDSYSTSVKLKRYGVLQGRVLSTTGEAVANAPVRITDGGDDRPLVEYSTTTDAAGYYRFDLPQDGWYGPKVGPVPSYGIWPAQGHVQSTVRVRADTTATYPTITMAPGGTVTGVLVAPPGISATNVCASVHLKSDAKSYGSACGPVGEPFAIPEVPVGTYFMCVSANEAPATCAGDMPGVTERVGQPEAPLDSYPTLQWVKMTTGATVPFAIVWGGTVTATVKLDTGAVLDGGCLRVEAPARGLDSTSCDPVGGVFAFAVPMDLEGTSVTWTLTGAANAHDKTWQAKQWTYLGRTFPTSVVAKAKGNAAIAVDVVGEDSEPLSAACVRLWTNQAAPVQLASSCSPGSQHVFDNLGPGTYTVSVTDVPGGFTQWWYGGGSGTIAVAEWIEVAQDDQPSLSLTVPTHHVVSGTVKNHLGESLSDGTVEFRDSAGVVRATGPVTAGEFSFETPVVTGSLRAVGFAGYADAYLGGSYTQYASARTGPAASQIAADNHFVLRPYATLVGTIAAPPALADGPVCIQLRSVQPLRTTYGPSTCGEVGDAFEIPVIQGQSYAVCVREATAGICTPYPSASNYTSEEVGQTSAPTAFAAVDPGPNPIAFTFGGTRVVSVTRAGSGDPALDGCITHLIDEVVVAHGCVDETGVARLEYDSDVDWDYGTLQMRGFSQAFDDDLGNFYVGVTNGETVALAVEVRPWQALEGTITRPAGYADTHACVFATDMVSVFEQVCLEPGTSAYALPLPPGEFLVQFYTEEPGVAYEWYNDKPTLAGAQWVDITRWDGFVANAALAASGRVEGVIRTADGLPATAGCAVAVSTNGHTAQTDCVDSDGHFALESLPPGTYKLKFTDVPGHAVRWYTGVSTFGGATKLSVKAGATTTANVTLALAAPVAGTVTVNGLPATSGCVDAYTLSGEHVTGACTDDAGAYAFTDLPAGTYKFFFHDFDDAANMWAGGSISFTKAATYSASPSAPRTLNAALKVASTISGAWSSSGGSTPPSTVYLYELDGTLVSSTRVVVTDTYDLSYEFPHVAPGKYELAVSVDGATYEEYYRPSGSLTPGVVTVPSATAAHITGITFRDFAPNSLQEQGAISGYLNVPSTWKSSVVCAVAVSRSGTPVVGDCGPRGGYFVIPDLFPDDVYHKVVFTNGEVRTAAKFKAFTGAKKYYGNTTSLSAAPAYAVRNGKTAYLPVWFYGDVSYKTANFYKIQWMGDHGIFKGYSDTTFKPGNYLTRRDFAIYLYRLAGSPKVTLPAKSPFTDVKAGSTGYTAMVWMYQRKLWTSSSFGPTTAVTRSTGALLLYKFAGSPPVTLPSKSPYADVKKSTTTTYKAIIWAKSKKVIGPASGSYFKPSAKVSRASGSVYLFNYWMYVG